jgi:hypothetical protein
MSLDELGQTVGRYAASAVAWLFVVIGPATANHVPPIDHPQPPGIDRLDDRHGAGGSDPERDSATPAPAPPVLPPLPGG